VWDGRDAQGRSVATGTYAVRLTTSTVTTHRLITLLK